MASPYWQMVKDRNFDEVPDTYLDWLLGQKWFLKMGFVSEVMHELETRRRSHYHVKDQFGKIID